MTFNIVAMICVAGMSPADCGPQPGFSRDVAVIGQVSNELWCGVEAQQDLAKSAPFRNLAEASSSKSCASETADRPSAALAHRGWSGRSIEPRLTRGPAGNASISC